MPLLKTLALMKLANPNPHELFMRLDDAILEDDDAEKVGRRMWHLIEASYTWAEPDQVRHQKALEESQEFTVTGRIKDDDETDKGYANRMICLDAWPAKSTAKEARWIWRAQMAILAMRFIYENGGCDFTEAVRIGEEWIGPFRPRDFYIYSWICLREGEGARAWENYGKAPPLPPKGLSVREEAERCLKAAEVLQETVLRLWNKGYELGQISGEMTWEDLMDQAPAVIEAREHLMGQCTKALEEAP